MKLYITYTGRVVLLLLLFTGKTWSQQNLTMVKDINPNTASAFNVSAAINVFFWEKDDKAIFLANNGTNGNELWTSDGTANGTYLLKDINPNGNISVNKNHPTATLGNDIIFAIQASLSGGNYWHLAKTDGTTGGTMMYQTLEGLIPGSFAQATILAAVNNTVLFHLSASSGAYGQLWKTDGTAAGTVMVKDINPASGDAIANASVVNNKLVFAASDGTNGSELWVSDGTADGTFMLKDINSGSGAGYYGNTRVVAGNLLFFITNDGNGEELWRTDGTPAGTFMVKDINNTTTSSLVSRLTVIGSQVYFTANDGVNGLELWKSDGTAAGTVMIKDIIPGSTSTDFGNRMYSVNGILYFTANDGVNGLELWKSDGTTAGTVMVKDINPGSGNSGIFNLYPLNRQCFFMADDGTHGNELWVSDGTAAGTHLVKDVTPGLAGTNFGTSVTGNGWLFFIRENGSIDELWKTDGTEFATVPVYTATNVNNYTVIGDNIYASTTTSAYGRELFFGNANAKLNQTITFDALPAKTYGDASFTLTATSSSGIPVTYTNSDESIAKIINGNQVQIVRAGTVTITAHQAGNIAYNAATDIAQQLTIGKATLTITAENRNRVQGMADPLFEVLFAGFVNGDDESDLLMPVSITTDAAPDAAPGKYNILLAGATSDKYDITFVNGILTVVATPLQAQTITFPTLPAKTAVDPDFDPGATASSGLQVLYTSSNPAVATIVNNQIHITGKGTSTIRATQPGDDVYDVAPAVVQTLYVVSSLQTITFDVLPQKTYGDAPFDPGATASSGLPVTYNSSNNNVAVIENGQIRITGVGNTVITANQPGDDQYGPASASQELTVRIPQLVITAENKTRRQGQDNPGFTITVSGFVNDDNIHSLATPVKYSTTATKASAPGVYDIIVSGASSPNYEIVFVNGKLTIEPAQVSTPVLDVWFNSTTSLLVNVYVNENQRAVVRLMDVSGRILVGRELQLASGQNSFTIPVNLAAGAYVIKVKGANIELDKKLLKR